jgi:hypothetical protein
LNREGSALVYSIYLGGSGADYAYALALGENGRAYVTGQTISVDFPTTRGAVQSVFGGGDSDGFVTVIGPDGDRGHGKPR